MAEQNILTHEMVARLFSDFAPNLNDQRAFGVRVVSYQTSLDKVEFLRNQINLAQDEAKLVLEEAQRQLILSQQRLAQGEDFITISPDNLYRKGNFGIIIGHIRVALYEKGHLLPLPLKFFTRWAKPVHPYLEPLLTQVNEADQVFKQIDSNQQKAQTGGKDRELDNLLIDTARSRNRLLLFCDDQAATSEELVKQYVAIIPQRAHLAAEKYADKHAFSEKELEKFYQFVNDMTRFIPPGPAYDAFRRQYQAIIRLGRTPLEEEMSQLRKQPKRVWKKWISFTLQERLSYEGLVEPPTVPQILRVG